MNVAVMDHIFWGGATCRGYDDELLLADKSYWLYLRIGYRAALDHCVLLQVDVKKCELILWLNDKWNLSPVIKVLSVTDVDLVNDWLEIHYAWTADDRFVNVDGRFLELELVADESVSTGD